LDNCIRDCIPDAVGVNIDYRSVAIIGPPTRRDYREALIGVSVVVGTQTTELHSVGNCSRMNWCGNCVSLVSAESTHAQTILVSLWT